MTYRELINEGTRQLTEHEIPDSMTDAWYLCQYVFDISRIDYLMDPGREADEALKEKYMDCIRLRANNYPLQYITHEQGFMGLDFYVDENVLIPRQDTEVLAETVLDFTKHDMSLLDMCTGSGCILISIAANKHLARAVGADISPAALEIAKKNASMNRVGGIEFIQSDLFENVEGTFDIIVSNPPYIPTKKIDTLMKEVRCHEPRTALDGENDGLHYYRRIIGSAARFLKEDGMIFFEIGWNQAKDVKRLLEAGGFGRVVVKKDLAGLNRVIYASKC